MARPCKRGLDYFPLDTVMDDDIKLIEAEFKLKGFAVIVKIYQKIYGGLGYYCEWTKEVEALFAYENHAGSGLVSEILEASFRRGIFDKNLYKKHSILTSRGIQKRYLEATTRRVQVDLKKEYLLLTMPEIREIVGNNPVSVNINTINDNRNPQIRENEMKEDYINISDFGGNVEEMIDQVLLKGVHNGN